MTCTRKAIDVSQKAGDDDDNGIKDGHGHGAERLEDAEEAVGVQEQAPVREAVLAHVTRRAREQSALWRLETHAECREDIGLCG